MYFILCSLQNFQGHLQPYSEDFSRSTSSWWSQNRSEKRLGGNDSENKPREHLDTVALICFQEFPGVMGVGNVDSIRIEKIGSLRLWRQGKGTPLRGKKVRILPLGDVED